jgi:Dolichyl-phosphate-mannose-protein mannosyltransferase
MKYYGAWAAAIVVAISSLWWPMRRDQGIFAWVGDVIMRGGLPYKDAWDIKGPLTYYVYALSQAIFGRTQWGIRALDLFFLTVTAYFLWRLTASLCDRRAANIAVPVFMLMYYQGYSWHTAQPDGWAGMLIVISVWLVVSDMDRHPYSRAAGFGLLVGMCTALKPLFACFLVLLPMNVPAGRVDIRKRYLLTLTSVAAFSSLLVLVAGWFAYRGALADLVDTLFSFNLTVYSRTSEFNLNEAFAHVALFFVTEPGWLIAALFAGIGLMALWSKNRSAFVMVGSWTVLSMLCIIIQNKFFYYHWIPVLAPLSIAAGAGVSRLADIGTFKPALSLMVKHGAVVLLVVAVSFGPLYKLNTWLRAVAGFETWDEYYGEFGRYGGGDVSFLADREVSKYLANRTVQGDRVYVWGFEPIIYYMSGRPSSTRYGFVQPLVGEDNVFKSHNRERFMMELHANPPVYIIVIDNDATPVTYKTSKQYLKDFPEFKLYLSSRYILEKRIEDFEIYRIKGRMARLNPLRLHSLLPFYGYL